ncbi:hypothetical protein BC938DRAFT_475585 [Jimgerdemannia flammicorona]|uniref:Uncharacterized protein n=1 Tax=Jimgerdemannia flammicorona TaxID=994334 RepID=A0A433PS37_9FUNG|nr:hypothetical protein BC938DRAFT_475585 [Jimgerdemannia flammicorona]
MLDLTLEPVYFIHIIGLVVPAREEQARGIEPLVCEESDDNLKRKGSTVNEVAVKEVHVGGGG